MRKTNAQKEQDEADEEQLAADALEMVLETAAGNPKKQGRKKASKDLQVMAEQVSKPREMPVAGAQSIHVLTRDSSAVV
jgi:hypothetical protein